MSFSEIDVTRRTRKGNFLNQIDYLIDWTLDHSVLSCFRTRLTQAHAWNGLLEKINQQIQGHDIIVTQGCHVDASITHSPLTQQQLQRNSLISKARYVVERTFGSQAR